MARKPKNRTYQVRVEGMYFKQADGKTDLAPYEETVRMDSSHIDAGPLYVFKNLLAPKLMAKKYLGYTGLHTHHLLSVVDEADEDAVPNNPSLMNADQLVAFIEHNELPVEVRLYEDVDALKQAVIDCLEDEDAFENAQEITRKGRGDSLELSRSLAKLNDGETGRGVEANPENVKESKIPDADDVELDSDKKPKKRGTPTDKFTEDDFRDDDSKKKPKKGGRPRKTDPEEENEDEEFDLD